MAALRLESGITVAGLVCELAGFLVMPKLMGWRFCGTNYQSSESVMRAPARGANFWRLSIVNIFTS